MATKTFSPILGKRIRVTQLNASGAVPAASTADAMAVSDGFISVNIAAEIEEGTELTSRKANGALCISERGNPSFKRLTLDITFCEVDPGLVSLVSNAVPYLKGAPSSDTIGFTMPEGEITKKFAFELWTGLSGGGDADASGYMLLPFVQAGVLSDIEVGGENATTFSLTGAYTLGGNSWGKGPYKVLKSGTPTPAAAVLPTALDPLDHFLLLLADVAPPVAAAGLQVMPSA